MILVLSRFITSLTKNYQIIIKLLISDFSLIECIQFINLFISQFNRHDNNLVINKFPILENESQNEQIKILQLYYLEMMFYLNQIHK